MRKKATNSIAINGILNIIQKCSTIFFPLITIPYLSRVLGATNFGKFSFSHSIVAYFLLFAMLGINTYAVREGASKRDNPQEILTFSKEITTINLYSVLLSFGVLLLVVFLGGFASDYQKLLLILSCLLPLTFVGRDWINVVYEDYLYTTVRYLIVQVLGVLLIFLLVKTQADYIIYTAIYALTSTLGYVINFFYTRRYVKFRLTRKTNIKKHLVPILILFVAQLAATIYIESDITMLGLYCTEQEVGIYSIASKVYSLIKAVINAITAVVIPRIVYHLSKGERDNSDNLLNKLFLTLFTIIFPLAVGICIFNYDVLLLIGGGEYVSGGQALIVLTITLPIAVFSGYFCNAVLVPAKKEKAFMWITVISATSNILLNLIMIPFFGILGAAITTLISEIVVVILSCIISRKSLRLKMNIKDIIAVFVGLFFVAGICIVIRQFVANSILRVVISGLSCAIIYAVVLFIFKQTLIKGIFDKIKNKRKKEVN